jgi:DNA-binding Lrp family transcriptional regulator
MAEPKLTKMQEKVLKELQAGHKASAISKKLKISPSGVYGHIRRMKEAGVEIPGQDRSQHVAVTRAAPPAMSLPTALREVSSSGNGVSVAPDPEKALRAALALGTARVEAINAEVDQLNARITELGAERENVIATGMRHEKALAAVLGDETADDAASSFFATSAAE